MIRVLSAGVRLGSVFNKAFTASPVVGNILLPPLLTAVIVIAAAWSVVAEISDQVEELDDAIRVLDPPRLRRGKLDLSPLFWSTEAPTVSRTDRLRFWRAYAPARGLDPDLGPVFEWVYATSLAMQLAAGEQSAADADHGDQCGRDEQQPPEQRLLIFNHSANALGDPVIGSPLKNEVFTLEHRKLNFRTSLMRGLGGGCHGRGKC